MKHRILIVDDEKSMCELLETALKRAILSRSGLPPPRKHSRRWSARFIRYCADGSQDARHGRHPVLRARGGQPSRHSRRRDDGIRQHGDRGRGDPGRCLRFRDETDRDGPLALTVARAANHRELQQKIRRLSEVVEKSLSQGEMLGNSAAMRELFDQLGRLAESDASVLICGDSGTGKELVCD